MNNPNYKGIFETEINYHGDPMEQVYDDRNLEENQEELDWDIVNQSLER